MNETSSTPMPADLKPLSGSTLLMSGGSRGIGLAIAVEAARLGANIAFIAKTGTPDPRLPGTVHTAAAEIEAAGGKVLPIIGDIRDESAIDSAVAATVERFGGIDIVVNNASAINLGGFGELTLKRYDLIQSINARGTFALITSSLPHLLRSPRPRVVTLSPPLNPDPAWFGAHAAYTVSKYSMTMLTVGLAEQFRDAGMAASCLWPATFISTAAVHNLLTSDGEDALSTSRTPQIMADAAGILLTAPAADVNGKCFLDEDILRGAGSTDLSQYLNPGAAEDNLRPDLFV
ncbi:MAG: SDR family oxidoreductase [Gordonia amarae]